MLKSSSRTGFSLYPCFKAAVPATQKESRIQKTAAYWIYFP